MEALVAYLARTAMNEYANSALPNAPVRPDPPRRRPVRRVIQTISRRVQGTAQRTRSRWALYADRNGSSVATAPTSQLQEARAESTTSRG
jgi:hypothetical protein